MTIHQMKRCTYKRYDCPFQDSCLFYLFTESYFKLVRPPRVKTSLHMARMKEIDTVNGHTVEIRAYSINWFVAGVPQVTPTLRASYECISGYASHCAGRSSGLHPKPISEDAEGSLVFPSLDVKPSVNKSGIKWCLNRPKRSVLSQLSQHITSLTRSHVLKEVRQGSTLRFQHSAINLAANTHGSTFQPKRPRESVREHTFPDSVKGNFISDKRIEGKIYKLPEPKRGIAEDILMRNGGQGAGQAQGGEVIDVSDCIVTTHHPKDLVLFRDFDSGQPNFSLTPNPD